MRFIICGIAALIASLSLMTTVPSMAWAQTTSQDQPGTAYWPGYYETRPYFHYSPGGVNHWGWTWQEGRYHYPGYRYYEYPHYGIRIYGGGTYYYAPGYHYPRRPQP